MSDNSSRSLHWFRNDLRLDDNPALSKSLEYAQTVPVYIIDEHFWTNDKWGHVKTGPFRSCFLFESIIDLKNEIEKLGGSLLIRQGKPSEILPSLMEQFSCNTLVAQSEHATEEIEIENIVENAVHDIGGKCYWIEGHTLYHPDDVFNLFKEIPDIFTQFRKSLESKCIVRDCIASPLKINCPDNLTSDDIPDLNTFLSHSGQKTPCLDKRSSFPFKGGLTQARKRLKHYFWDKHHLSLYKKTRNKLTGIDFSSKLSPWLAHGCISPRRIRSEVKRYENLYKPNESTYWLVFELIWRDYFRFISMKYGSRIFYHNGIKSKTNLSNQNMSSFELWKNGKTNDSFVNANMNELLKTGYMSNRGRQNVASYLVHDLGVDWRLGASWFEHLLLDYDVASNTGNWIYIAGVGNDPRANRKFDTIRQAKIYDGKNTYQNLWGADIT